MTVTTQKDDSLFENSKISIDDVKEHQLKTVRIKKRKKVKKPEPVQVHYNLCCLRRTDHAHDPKDKN